MTRDERRAACIEAMAKGAQISITRATWAFDALHGLARVCPIEATEEMISVGVEHRDISQDGLGATFNIMSAAGDLTNAPERKT